jgi:Co/Zn/Cd efflux system component
MFGVELIASIFSGSTALAADSADFLGDSVNYALSLGALAMGGAWLSRVALLKGGAMSVYGIAVLAYAAWRAWLGVPPEPLTMGIVGTLALAVNFGVAALLYRFREGDANMRSVWLCTRNDVIANILVLVAAAGVFGTGTGWRPSGIALPAELVLPLSSSLRVPRETSANAGAALERAEKPRCLMYHATDASTSFTMYRTFTVIVSSRFASFPHAA